MTEENENQAITPRVQEIITGKQAFFERYEQFIDFYELERMIERRGKLAMPELALHIVRARGQKLLEIYRTQASMEVALASHEEVHKTMAKLYEQFKEAEEKYPQLAHRYESMMIRLLDRLETIPIEDMVNFRSRF